jgi:selenocysteine lyase/cysteine desulfurase
MELRTVRELFPITERYVYLNHASCGPPSVRVAAAMEQCIRDLQRHGMANQVSRSQRLQEIRGLAASLIGAQPEEIAFTPNTSQGLFIIANGIDWCEGDNVVSAETEFTANVYPWRYLRRRGVRTRFVPSRNGRIAPADVSSCIDGRTRLVALSFVEWWTGFRNDLSTIGSICRERDVYFSVDAVQGLGGLRLDVRKAHVDFLSAAGYKWLLSPYGSGFFYCREGLIDELIPVMVSWRSVVPGDYPPYEEALWPDARRFEPSYPGWVALYGLGASLETLLDVGPQLIEQRIKSLTDHLIDGLWARGYRIISPVEAWEERSGIVTFDHSEHDLADVHERLREAGVMVDSRYSPGVTSPYPSGIRVSPHFYNTTEEIDYLLEGLP